MVNNSLSGIWLRLGRERICLCLIIYVKTKTSLPTTLGSIGYGDHKQETQQL